MEKISKRLKAHSLYDKSFNLLLVSSIPLFSAATAAVDVAEAVVTVQDHYR